jgi:NADH:ubiquinone oxidoreductase subunit 5 (subunit L)/multisubunit Na+/H+ antiporter MnhA subunit
MYFLVFEGEPKAERKVHETPGIMLLVLAILAIGAVISWVMVDMFSAGFVTFNIAGPEFHAHPLGDFVSHTFTSTAFLLSLAALGVGVLLYFARNSLKTNKVSLWIIKYGRQGFGFDKLYEDVLVGVKKISIHLRRFQTGDANMNFVGVVIIMIVLFVMLLAQGVF